MSSIGGITKGNYPAKIDYALYINGVYVPAAGANITISGSEIQSVFYLAPSEEINLLGYNDRIHFAFFVKDPVSAEYVLFTEGEIIGYSEQIMSSSSFVSLTGRSFKNVLDMPISSIVGSPESLNEVLNTQVAPAIAPASFVLFSGFIPPTSGGQQSQQDVAKNKIKLVSTPFDYVSSLFSLIFKCGEVLFSSKDADSEQNKPDEWFKKLAGSYIYRFFYRYILGKNLIRKIIPDVSLGAKISKQVEAPVCSQSTEPNYLTEKKEEVSKQEETEEQYDTFYRNYMQAVQTMEAIRNTISNSHSGSLIDIVNNIVGLYEVFSVPMSLPPLVYLKRTITSDKSDLLTYDMYGHEYIGDVIYRNSNLFTVIPRSNYITSANVENVNFNCAYLNRVTRLYTYFQIPNQPQGNIFLNLIASYPEGIINNVIGKEGDKASNYPINPESFDLSMLISREEAFRGVNRKIIPPHPMHWLGIITNANGLESGFDKEYLLAKENRREGKMELLQRYVFQQYVLYRSMPVTCTIVMPFNPYIIPSYPLLFANAHTENSFVGIVESVSYSFMPDSVSTTISLSNVLFLEEYLTLMAETTEKYHPDYRAPAPFIVPNVDYLTQTYEGGEIYFGELFYRNSRYGSVIRFEDIFQFKDKSPLSFKLNANKKSEFLSRIFFTSKIETTNEEGQEKELTDYRIRQTFSVEKNRIVVKDNAPGLTDKYLDYLKFVYRPGVSLTEYLAAHNDTGLPTQEPVHFVDGDKLDTIFKFPSDPTDDINSTLDSLTYLDWSALLKTYTRKILSKTPEYSFKE